MNQIDTNEHYTDQRLTKWTIIYMLRYRSVVQSSCHQGCSKVSGLNGILWQRPVFYEIDQSSCHQGCSKVSGLNGVLWEWPVSIVNRMSLSDIKDATWFVFCFLCQWGTSSRIPQCSAQKWWHRVFVLPGAGQRRSCIWIRTPASRDAVIPEATRPWWTRRWERR